MTMLYSSALLVACILSLCSASPFLQTGAETAAAARLNYTESLAPTNVSNVNTQPDALGYNNVTASNNSSLPAGFDNGAQLAVMLGVVNTSSAEDLGPLPDIAPPPPDNATFSITSDVIDYPNLTNLSVIVNPLNLSASDILPDTALGKRLEPRQAGGDGPTRTWRISVNGLYITVAFGSRMARNIFEVATTGIWSDLQQFTNNNEYLRESKEFVSQILIDGAPTNTPTHSQDIIFFAQLIGTNPTPLPMFIVELAFQSMFKLLLYREGTETERDLPFSARSFTLTHPNGITPMLFGYFKPGPIVEVP